MAVGKEKVDDEGFEPSTFRMQNGRSTTELNALRRQTAASLAQSVERKALNLVVVGSSPTGGAFWLAAATVV